MKLNERLLLELSDCDGMCNHCPPVLKKSCIEHKKNKPNDNKRKTN